jgi:hypothetical protein
MQNSGAIRAARMWICVWNGLFEITVIPGRRMAASYDVQLHIKARAIQVGCSRLGQ